ncbi:MAG: hypothetical protein JO042_16430 [Sinobacteraceae bacterium]|nr:hypothetical protein [Nevskiaceae bacterium]
MMPAVDAERISGYKVGGISPFGQMRLLPTAIETQALAHEWVFVNGASAGYRSGLIPTSSYDC